MVGEVGAVDLVPVEVDQVAARVGHLVPVARQAGRARAQLGGDVPVPEQALESGVTAGLVRQDVGRRGVARAALPVLDALGVGAERVALCAVHREAYVVGGLRVLVGVGIRRELLGFG